MTDEEKQAIEYLKKLCPMMWWRNPDGNGTLRTDIKLQTTIDITLNLIEKQQKEIKNWEDHCTVDLEREITKLNNENFEYKAEIEKKDMIIDEMAKCMKIDGTGRRGFSCMFRENGECNENGCRVCIKEYFKKKVEDK